MLELFEEDEVFLKDFIRFLHKSKFLADDVKTVAAWDDALIKMFVKDFNDSWKREIREKQNAGKNRNNHDDAQGAV